MMDGVVWDGKENVGDVLCGMIISTGNPYKITFHYTELT